MSWLASIPAAMLGFFAAGLGWARLLRAPAPWVAAFFFSLASLFIVVFVCAMLGVPILLQWVAGGMAIPAAIPWLVMRGRDRASDGAEGASAAPISIIASIGDAARSAWRAYVAHDRGDRVLLAAAGLLAAIFAVKAALLPLTGWDTMFRWDFLALRMLETGSLSYYPPATAADFRVYFYVDSISPLVALGNWLLYASCGEPVPRATALFVTPQFVLALVLAYRLAALVGGSTRAGVLAAVILASTPMYLRAVHIGQETGLTALAALATLYYLHCEEREGSAGVTVVAGVAAGVGALAREYGCVLLPVGLALLLARRASPRRLVAFAAAFSLVAAPWYLRTWARTGNPFYSIDVAGLFTVNPVYQQIMLESRRQLGLTTFDAGRIEQLLAGVALRSTIPLLIGTAAALWLLRRAWWLALTAVLFVMIWGYSVGVTQGGVIYSTRVLSVTWAMLSVAAGVGLSQLPRSRGWRMAVNSVVIVAVGWAVLIVAVLPMDPQGLPADRWVAAMGRTQTPPRPERHMAEAIVRKAPPGLRILTDNMYLHAALVGTTVDAVPYWSPEVRFLFEQGIDPLEARRRLRDLGITAVAWADDNIHQKALEQSPLLGQDRARWRRVMEFGPTVIYVLPPP